MDNCLKTQLKASVIGTYAKLGELIIPVKALASITNDRQLELGIKNGTSPNQLSVDGSGSFTINGGNPKTSVDLDPNESVILKLKNNNYNIHIQNKYNIKEFEVRTNNSVTSSVVCISGETLDYLLSLTLVYLNYTKGSLDLSYLKNSPSLEYLTFYGSDQVVGFEEVIPVIKDSIKYIQGYSSRLHFDVTDIPTLPQITNLNISNNNVQGILDCSKFPLITNINFSNTLVSGNINTLNSCTEVTIANFKNTSMGGSINDLSGCVEITSLDTDGTNVTGTIDGFVAAQSGGRPTCSTGVEIDYALKNHGLNDRFYQDKYCFITWESTVKIAVLTGSSSMANCNTVYTKGYTLAEAETNWPGKSNYIAVDGAY